MNYHFRSQSEQYQPAGSQQPQQPVESFIRVHTDSQQSLDRLFNPPASAYPLRSRNLPRSFFEPSLGRKDETTISTTNGNPTQHQSFHTRSMSYGQQPLQSRGVFHGNSFHQRTMSTLAPMPDTDSGQSSLECLSSTPTRTTYDHQAQQQQQQPVSSTTNGIQVITGDQAQQPPPPPPPNVMSSADWSSPATSMEDLNGVSGVAVNQMPPTQPPMGQHQPLSRSHELGPVPETPTVLPHHHHHHHHNPGPNFYQPAVTSATNGNYLNNFHSRSMSFDQHRPVESVRSVNQNNFHTRTHSTIVPMPANVVTTNGPPYQTSSEFLNYTNNNQCATNWSSSGCSSDDMSTTASGHNFWTPVSQQQATGGHTTLTTLRPQQQQPQHSLQEIGAISAQPPPPPTQPYRSQPAPTQTYYEI